MGVLYPIYKHWALGHSAYKFDSRYYSKFISCSSQTLYTCTMHVCDEFFCSLCMLMAYNVQVILNTVIIASVVKNTPLTYKIIISKKFQ